MAAHLEIAFVRPGELDICYALQVLELELFNI